MTKTGLRLLPLRCAETQAARWFRGFGAICAGDPLNSEDILVVAFGHLTLTPVALRMITFTPVYKGGTDSPENLQLLCFHCNMAKGTKLMSDPKVKALRTILCVRDECYIVRVSGTKLCKLHSWAE